MQAATSARVEQSDFLHDFPAEGIAGFRVGVKNYGVRSLYCVGSARPLHHRF